MYRIGNLLVPGYPSDDELLCCHWLERKTEMDELRSWFEVPAIAHFFHVFKDAFDLIDFEIEDFEEALFLDSAENVSSFLPDLVIRLLRGLYKTKDGLQVTMENYNHYLQDLLHYRFESLEGKENPIAAKTFNCITTREKIDIIYDMCDWRLEMEDAMELTKNLEADEMRIEPFGVDADNNVYWYFFGTRLYKETVTKDKVDYDSEEEQHTKTSQKTTKSKKTKKKKKKRSAPVKISKYGRTVKKRKLDYNSQKSEGEDDDDEDEEEVESDEEAADNTEKTEENKSDESIQSAAKKPKVVNPWCLACSTFAQWEELLLSFKSSKNKDEICLYRNLVDFMDTLPEIFVEREKAVQRKLMALQPRRASDRIQLKVQQREIEDRLQEQERLMRSQQKAREAEERHFEIQKEREKERERRYKEREKNFEQRALRAKQREELKLVADNPELAKEIQKANNEKAYKTIAFATEGEEDDIFFAMERVLDTLRDFDDAWPFLEAVDAEEAPNYYTFIEKPMDLEKMAEKVKNKEYKDKHEFENDLLLMIDNCETYNGTHSAFTKLAFKVKKVFDKSMKREFPPDVDYSDDLYEESQQQDTKPPKPKKLKVEKPPKQKKVAAVRQTAATKSAMQSLQSSYNRIITPEFAHAQILQARLHQGKVPVVVSPKSTVPQILPKLGIPQDILAKMTPAQLQMYMLQYRTGAISAIGKTPGTQFTPSTSNTVNIKPLTPSSVHNIASVTSPLSSLYNAQKNRIPVALPKSGNVSALTQNNIQLSQLLSLQPRTDIARKYVTNSPLIPMKSPSSGTPLLQVKQTSAISSMAKLHPSSLPTTIIPPGVSWESIKKSLKAQSNSPAITSSYFNVTVSSGIIAPTNAGNAVTIAGSHGLVGVLMNHPPITTTSGMVVGLRPSTTPVRAQLSTVATPRVNAILPSASGRLMIRGRSNQAIRGEKRNVTTNAKQLGIPLLKPGVRFIGQPDGKIRKIIMVPSSSVISGKSFVQSPAYAIASTTTTTIPRIEQRTTKQQPVLLPMPASRILVNPGSVANKTNSIQLKRPISQAGVPVYLTPQGVPLQFIKPEPTAVKSIAVRTLSSSTPAAIGRNITSLLVSSATIPAPLPHSSQLDRHISQVKDLHGLKKAIQQVAAVNQISSKLQSHLQDERQVMKTESVMTSAVPAKPIAGVLSIDSLRNKIVVPSVSAILPAVNKPMLTSPSTENLSAVTFSVSSSTPMSNVSALHNKITSMNSAQLPSIATVSDTNSFILTTSGLVSVNKHTVDPNNMLKLTTLTQNIIASNAPPIISNKQVLLTSTSNHRTSALLPSSAKQTFFQNTTAISQRCNSTKDGSQEPVISPSTIVVGVSQEKLRDAEALLGLNDPKRLNLPTTPHASNGNDAINSLSHTLVPPNVPNLERSNTTCIVNPSHQSICMATNHNGMTEQPTQIKVSTGNVIPLKLSANSGIDSSKSSLMNIENLSKSPVKIQLPGSSSATPFRTISSSFLIVSSPTVALTQSLGKKTTISSSPTVVSSFVNKNNISDANICGGNDAASSRNTAETPQKLVVDQSQIQKLQSEGRLVMSPTGQLFLLAQPVSKMVPPNS